MYPLASLSSFFSRVTSNLTFSILVNNSCLEHVERQRKIVLYTLFCYTVDLYSPLRFIFGDCINVCVCPFVCVMVVQVARLTQQEQSLEQRLETVYEENAGLRDSVSSLHTRLTLQEQQSNTQTQQVYSTHVISILYSQFECLEFSG